MTIRPFLTLLLLTLTGAATVAACGSSDKACGLTCDDGDDDGSGGTGSGTTTTDATGTTSSGGSCTGCADFLSDPATIATICTSDGPPTSQELATGLLQCACEGLCPDTCADTFCNGQAPSPPCAECLGGCESFDACASAPGTSSAATTSSSSTGGGPCATCFEVVTGQAMGSDICTDDGPPSSAELLDAMMACACEGNCAAECGPNLCATGAPEGECQTCLLSDTGCGPEASACANTAG